MRRMLSLWVGLALCVAYPTAHVSSAAIADPGVDPPPFDPADFGNSTRIDHPYMPLTPGTTYRYEGVPRGQSQVTEITVMRDSRTILGVRCVIVRDRVWIKGRVEEDTFDWFAEDREGNVWYMGEEVRNYKNGVLVDNSGSWEAGVAGARPGIVMHAHPMVGTVYRQEYLAGEAEDLAQVVSTTGSAFVPYGSWAEDVLVTQEWTPLEPSRMEQKYYARGVGLVKTETIKGGSEGIELVSVR